MMAKMKLSLKIWMSIGVLILGYCLSVSLSHYDSYRTQQGLLSLSEFTSVSSDLSQGAVVAFSKQIQCPASFPDTSTERMPCKGTDQNM